MCLTLEVVQMNKFKRIIVSVFAAILVTGVGVAVTPADGGQLRADWACC